LLTRKSLISSNNALDKGGEGAFRFGREERLKGRNEIREVFKTGKRYGCRGAKLFMLKNELPYNRICFTFSRVTKSREGQVSWNAVQRNRARRLGREAYRFFRPRLLGGQDLVLLFYPESVTLSERKEQIESLFKKAGLLK